MDEQKKTYREVVKWIDKQINSNKEQFNSILGLYAAYFGTILNQFWYYTQSILVLYSINFGRYHTQSILLPYTINFGTLLNQFGTILNQFWDSTQRTYQ